MFLQVKRLMVSRVMKCLLDWVVNKNISVKRAGVPIPW